MDELAQSAMDAVTDGRVKIVPERYAKGYLDWLSEKRDWPIGRQLWWGHRIPVWSRHYEMSIEQWRLILKGKWLQTSQDDLQIDSSLDRCMNRRCSLRTHDDDADRRFEMQHPTNSEFTAFVCVGDQRMKHARRIDATCAVVGDADLQQADDVLDTWFSSALWPHSTLGWPDETPELKTFYPTSALIT